MKDALKGKKLAHKSTQNFGEKMIKLNGTVIEPTLFPDGTSQVWKLPNDLLLNVYKDNLAKVEWLFENEAELIHLAQLKTLLDTYTTYVNLSMPFLPYGRQDKRVDNKETFALRSFASLINALKFNSVTTIDAHSNTRANLINNLEDGDPRKYIFHAVDKIKADFAILPDVGAALRYGAYFHGRLKTRNISKDRDPETGWITNVRMEKTPSGLKNKIVLIVDDICDGGLTFRLVAECLKKEKVKEIHLYITHGIFSKGLEPLHEAGIKRIFTYKGEVKEDAKSKSTARNGRVQARPHGVLP